MIGRDQGRFWFPEVVLTTFCLPLCLAASLSQSSTQYEQDVGHYSDASSKHFKPDTANAQPVDNNWTIHSRVVEITVSFVVTDGRKPIDDLTKEEIAVVDDNQPARKISAFGHQSDLPLNLALLIDTSDSVTTRFEFEQEAAGRFMRAIVRPKLDRAFVM